MSTVRIKPLQGAGEEPQDSVTQKGLHGVVKKIDGTVEIINEEGSRQQLKEGDEVREGSHVVTGDESRVILQFITGEQCVIHPNAKIPVSSVLTPKTEALPPEHPSPEQVQVEKAIDYDMAPLQSALISEDYQCIDVVQEDDGFNVVSNTWWSTGNIFAGWASNTFSIEFPPIKEEDHLLRPLEEAIFASPIVQLVSTAPPVIEAAPPAAPGPIASPPPAQPPEQPPPEETPVFDLALEKIVDNVHPCVGEIITFTITMQSTSASTGVINDVFVQDIFPSQFLQYISSSATLGIYNPATGLWSLDGTPANGMTLQPGQQGQPGDTHTLTITALVLPQADFAETVGLIGNGQNTTALQQAWLEGPGHTADAFAADAYNFGEAFQTNTGQLLTTGTGTFTFDPDGMGVAGNYPGSASPNQIGFNPNTGQTEAIQVSLDGHVANSATIYVSHLFLDEQQGEYGKVTAFDATGNAIGSIFFGETQNGLLPGVSELADGSKFVDVNYGSSNNVGNFTITADMFGCQEFSYLVFSAIPYGSTVDGADITTDSSDYYLQAINYTQNLPPINFINTATVFTTDPNVTEITLNNNSFSAPVEPQEPDLCVIKEAVGDLEFVTNGSEIIYTITVTNIGFGNAEQIVLTDILPTGLDFLSQQSSVAALFANNNDSLTWTLVNPLGHSQSATFTLTAVIDIDDGEGIDFENLANTATASSECDVNLANNSGTETLNLQITNQPEAITAASLFAPLMTDHSNDIVMPADDATVNVAPEDNISYVDDASLNNTVVPSDTIVVTDDTHEETAVVTPPTDDTSSINNMMGINEFHGADENANPPADDTIVAAGLSPVETAPSEVNLSLDDTSNQIIFNANETSAQPGDTSTTPLVSETKQDADTEEFNAFANVQQPDSEQSSNVYGDTKYEGDADSVLADDDGKDSDKATSYVVDSGIVGTHEFHQLVFSALTSGALNAHLNSVEPGDHYAMQLEYQGKFIGSSFTNAAHEYLSGVDNDPFNSHDDAVKSEGEEQHKEVIFSLQEDGKNSIIFDTVKNDKDHDNKPDSAHENAKPNLDDSNVSVVGQQENDLSGLNGNVIQGNDQNDGKQPLTEAMLFSNVKTQNPVLAEAQSMMDGGNSQPHDQMQQQQQNQQQISSANCCGGGQPMMDAISETMQQQQNQSHDRG